MALSLWKDRKKPLDMLENLKKEMDDWFDEHFLREGGERKAEGFLGRLGIMRYPSVDIQEENEKYIVRAELPGMSKNEIVVEYCNGHLIIKGEKRFEHEESKRNFHRIERSYGKFQRSLEIPDEIDATQIKGEYKDGVLQVVLPMVEAGKRTAHKISIS